MVPITYRLTPPFLFVPENGDFADAWERFCCKLLNIEHKTTEIFVRNPPEQGVDLYYTSKKIAYQCKSVESGKAGDFNTTHAVTSYKAALANQSAIGWTSYVLCTNVDISGSAETTLRKSIPGLTILPASYWQGLCERYPRQVERNFRVIVDVQARSAGNSVWPVLDEPITLVAGGMGPDHLTVLVYCNRHDRLYRVPVRRSMSVLELIQELRGFFRLPETATIAQENLSVSLTHAIALDGRPLVLQDTLAAAGVSEGSVLTYWLQFSWTDLEGEFRGNVIHMAGSMLGRKSLNARIDSARTEFQKALSRRFEELDASLAHAEMGEHCGESEA